MFCCGGAASDTGEADLVRKIKSAEIGPKLNQSTNWRPCYLVRRISLYAMGSPCQNADLGDLALYGYRTKRMQSTNWVPCFVMGGGGGKPEYSSLHCGWLLMSIIH